jgi:hypothetical protein
MSFIYKLFSFKRQECQYRNGQRKPIDSLSGHNFDMLNLPIYNPINNDIELSSRVQFHTLNVVINKQISKSHIDFFIILVLAEIIIIEQLFPK